MTNGDVFEDLAALGAFICAISGLVLGTAGLFWAILNLGLTVTAAGLFALGLAMVLTGALASDSI